MAESSKFFEDVDASVIPIARKSTRGDPVEQSRLQQRLEMLAYGPRDSALLIRFADDTDAKQVRRLLQKLRTLVHFKGWCLSIFRHPQGIVCAQWDL